MKVAKYCIYAIAVISFVVCLYLMISVGGEQSEIAKAYNNVTTKSEFASFISPKDREQWTKKAENAIKNGNEVDGAYMVPITGKTEEDVYRVHLNASVGRAPSYGGEHNAMDFFVDKNGSRDRSDSAKVKQTTNFDTADNSCSDWLVIAAKSGTVDYAGNMSGYGNVVIIITEDSNGEPDGYLILMAHLQAIKDGITRGAKVKQGDSIGLAGSTGSNANHLHYQVKLNDGGRYGSNCLDPLTLKPINNSSFTGDPYENVVAKYVVDSRVDEFGYRDKDSNDGWIDKKNTTFQPGDFIENGNGYLPRLVPIS